MKKCPMYRGVQCVEVSNVERCLMNRCLCTDISMYGGPIPRLIKVTEGMNTCPIYRCVQFMGVLNIQRCSIMDRYIRALLTSVLGMFTVSRQSFSTEISCWSWYSSGASTTGTLS